MSIDWFADLTLLRQIALGILVLGAVLGVWRGSPLYPVTGIAVAGMIASAPELAAAVQRKILAPDLLFTPDWWLNVVLLAFVILAVGCMMGMLISVNRTHRTLRAMVARTKSSRPQPFAEHE